MKEENQEIENLDLVEITTCDKGIHANFIDNEKLKSFIQEHFISKKELASELEKNIEFHEKICKENKHHPHEGGCFSKDIVEFLSDLKQKFGV